MSLATCFQCRVHFFRKLESLVSVDVSELFNTERSHVHKLEVMNGVFYQPMCANPAIDRKIIHIIFPNLEDLLHVHSLCSLYLFNSVSS